MDSLQPLSDKADSLYTVGDEFDNKLYFSSLSSKRVTGLVDLINLLVKVDLNGPIMHWTSSTLIGEGAQFRVFESEIMYHENSELVGRVFAMKQPRFFREANTALDLRIPRAQQHLHDLRLEILALCHPDLSRHPNIVKLLFWGIDTSSWHTSLYLGQELALSDLKSFLQEDSNNAELSWSIRYRLCLDVGAGLDAIHNLQIVHGDLKPENILVFDQDGLVAKLSDFGMSLCDDTQPGELLRGTPGWQAPEIHSAGTLYYLDHIKADNYSFGLVIWSTMFLDGTSVSTQDFTSMKAMNEGRNQTSDCSSHITVIQAVRQLLHVNPDHRPDSVSDLLDDSSVLYQQWASEYPDEDTSTSGSETTTCTPIPDLEMVTYDWEPPILGDYCLKHLRNIFKDDVWLIDPPVLLTMFLGSLRDWQRNDHPKAQDQDTLLKPLVAAAILGFDPAKGLLPLLHKGLQRRLPQRFQMEWLREAVETGSWIAGTELRTMNYDMYTAAVHTFRTNGGYNKFYTDSNKSIDLHGKHVQDAIDKPSTKDERDLNICSITTFADTITVKEVLENKTTNINMLGTGGYTPLWIACARGEWPIVELLLAYGADPTITREPGGITCLHWIFHFDEMWIDQASKALVKSGADVNALLLCSLPIFHYPFKLPAGTPLHWAVSVGQETAIKSLLDCGADPFIRNGEAQYLHNEDPVKSRIYDEPVKSLGLSPLDLAALEREPCIFGMLIPEIAYEKINNVDEEGCSVFHRLDSGHWEQTCSGVRYPKQLFRGNPQLVQQKLRETIHALLKLGTDINQLTTPKKRSLGRQTPLMLAVQANQFETVIELLKAGADVNFRNNEGKNTLFFLNCVGSSYEDERALKILKLLCSYGANFNCSADDGSTPILIYPRFAITDFLLDIGVEIEQRLSDRFKFWFATMNTLGLLLTRPTEYESEVAKVLLKHLGPIRDSLKRNNLIEQADLKGRSLLYLASESRNLESVVVLINQGAEINRIRTYMSFEGGSVKLQFSMTPLDAALEGRDSSLNILYQRKTSHLSKSELEREAKQYDKIAATLRKAGGLKASQCKDIPSYFRSSKEKKPMNELYRSKSFHSDTEYSKKYRGRRLTKEVGLIIPQFDSFNVETSKFKKTPRSWLRSNSI